MKKFTIVSSVSAIFIIMTFVLLKTVIYNKSLSENQNNLVRESIMMKEEIKVSLKNEKDWIGNMGIQLSNNLLLENSYEKTIKLMDFNYRNNIFIFINSFPCETCVKKVLEFVNQLTQKYELTINIVRPSMKKNDLEKFVNDYNIKYPTYLILNDKLGLEAQNNMKAFMFGFDSELRTNVFYSLENDLSEFKNEFIDWTVRVLSCKLKKEK